MRNEFLSKIMWRGSYIRKAGTNTSYLIPEIIKNEMDLEEAGRIVNSSERKSAKLKIIEDRTLILQDLQKQGKVLLLPVRISLDRNCSAKVSYSGRGTRDKVAQMKSCFTKCEYSPYKIHKPYKVCTSIWGITGHKCVYYGTIGLNPADDQKPEDNGDLVLYYTSDWDSVDVFIFKGLARPNEHSNLEEAVSFVESII